MNKADIGLVGLAVMGENLVLNMASKGFSVAVYNRTTKKVDEFVNGRGAGKGIIPAHSLEELVHALKPPRKVMMMIKAGKPVDAFIEQISPLLEPGDIIIDGGNSNYLDTIRRTRAAEARSLRYIGTGVSGGEEGALTGPSIMPGGTKTAWEEVKTVFQSISAKVEDGSPCCWWVGSDGAGHFVKMVHNGIEYGDMQLICEAYAIMKDYLNMNTDEIADVFKEWNQGDLDSYLIEITGNIMAYKDGNNEPLVEKILDTAGQKGTGKWTGIAALEQGVGLTLIAEAVFARCISALKTERAEAAQTYEREKKTKTPFEGDRDIFLNDLKNALYASKIISYAQGYALLRSAAQEYGWDLNYGEIALMWRGGCIIRSVFLGKIKDAFDKNPDLKNLILDPFFKDVILKSETSWRKVTARAIEAGVSVPAMTSALTYFDGYTKERLPANLLQAQRDYFGAHTYERLDKERGVFFHTNWTGKGGSTASSTYNV